MRKKNQGLGREERLRSKLLWQKVIDEGETDFCYPIKLKFLHLPDQAQLQAAFVAPKRRFRLAVNRNREKRYLKEAYRLSPHRPEPGYPCILVFMSVAGSQVEFQVYKKAMDTLLLHLKNHQNDHGTN